MISPLGPLGFRSNFVVECLGLLLDFRISLASILSWEADCLHGGFRSCPKNLQGIAGNSTASLQIPSDSPSTITPAFAAI
jgi:hypothetical protein